MFSLIIAVIAVALIVAVVSEDMLNLMISRGYIGTRGCCGACRPTSRRSWKSSPRLWRRERVSIPYLRAANTA